MGIFGTQAPKFISGGSTVLLDYAKIVRDEPDIRTLKLESELSGHKIFIPRGKHWFFDVVINLWKYGDPAAKYSNLKGFENAEVELYRHRDGDPFKLPGGDPAPFYLLEVTAFTLEDVDYRDRVVMRFESIDSVDEEGSTIIVPQISDISVITL